MLLLVFFDEESERHHVLCLVGSAETPPITQAIECGDRMVIFLLRANNPQGTLTD